MDGKEQKHNIISLEDATNYIGQQHSSTHPAQIVLLPYTGCLIDACWDSLLKVVGNPRLSEIPAQIDCA